MKVAADQFRRRYPQTNPQQGFAVQPLRDSIVSDVRTSLLVLVGAVSFVLLIACANVANLLLVRATGRKREFAIRAAMGASRSRIMRQLLTESVLLSLVGGVLGLILGFVGVRALLAVSPGGIPRIGENGVGVGIDWRVLGFTLGVSLLTGIVFGLFPALSASSPDLNSTLKESSNRAGTGFRQGIARSLLVITEVWLAVVLLIGAALLIRTFIALHGVNPGFNAHNVLTMEMSLTGDRFAKTAGVAQMVRNGRERLNAIPGVETSASTCCLPLEGGFGLPFIVVGRPLGKDPATGGAGWMNVSPGYFDVYRIPILRGRDFTDQDVAGAPGVVIINQAMAKKFWPKENPVGQQIIIGKGVGPEFEEPARQIVGIVGDIRDGGLNREPRPIMIIPQAQVLDGITALNARIGPVVWLVRTHTDPHQFISTVTEQLRQASGGFPVARVRTMEEVVVRSTAREDFNMLLLTIFGASALILAAIGIYGLMAYSVQQRTQEMGIRMALGADRAKIRNLVVRHGMTLALIGVVIGVGAAFGLMRLLASFLFGVKMYDPAVFVTIPVILSAVAFGAVWFPATRASKLDPMQALRVE
jgi:predicted permease